MAKAQSGHPVIGCLTGNRGVRLLEGEYAFHAPGLKQPCAPDLEPDRCEGHGPFVFSKGHLTDGDAATGVGWQGTSVGEVGVDVKVNLGSLCFVDQVVLRQPARLASPAAAPTGADNIEAAGHAEPEGICRVEVYARRPGDAGMSLVGQAGQRGPANFPEGPIRVNVGAEAQELAVRLISFNAHIRVSELEIWGAEPGEPALFPVPAKLRHLPGEAFIATGNTRIMIGASASEDSGFAANLLAEKLGERCGLAITVAEDAEGEAGQQQSGSIIIGKPGECDRLDALGMPVPSDAEGYTLRVDADRAAILANDRRGLIYGAESLLQLLTSGGEPKAAPCLVEDAPRLPFRGVHLYLPARDQLGFAKRLIRDLLTPMKLNTIFMELAGALEFDRRPEIAETWAKNNRLAAEGKVPPVPHGKVCGGGTLTKAEFKDLVEYARSFGIEVIPEIQSLSHVQYLTMTYPEIAEKPVPGGYSDSYCPLHPESRKIVFDMIDEVAELLAPLRYVHMGHDEVYTMAECPRCKGKSRDELFAKDVNEIHAHLKEKGVGMMIWADMLQPWQRYSGTEAATMIPKDIVMLEFVWYFRTWADTEDHLLKNGFQVIFGNCYSSHFTRYESRTSKPGVVGAEVSVWSSTDEESMARIGKIYDMVYSANTGWSPYCQDELRWTFDRKIVELMPGMRADLRGLPRSKAPTAERCRALDLQPHFTAPRRDPSGAKGGYDLGGLPTGDADLRGLPFRFGEGVVLVEGPQARTPSSPNRVEVPLEGKVSGLLFAHSCTGMAQVTRGLGARPILGRYEVHYADGTKAEMPVAFGHHVAEWNRRHGAPLSHRAHRHAGYVATYPADPLWQGKTPSGDDVTLYSCEWVNPFPNKEVKAVAIVGEDAGADVSLMVAGITAVRP